MGRQKNKSIPKYAGSGEFVPITKKMLLSQAWRKMTANQQRLYVLGRFCCFNADHPRKDFPDLLMMQKMMYFICHFKRPSKWDFIRRAIKKDFMRTCIK